MLGLGTDEELQEILDISGAISNAILLDQLYFEYVPLALRVYKEVTLAVVQETPETIEARGSVAYNVGRGIGAAGKGVGAAAKGVTPGLTTLLG